MKTFFLPAFILIFVVATSPVYAQIRLPLSKTASAYEKDLQVNAILDSLMTRAQLLNGGIVCVNDTAVTVDTLSVARLKSTEDDSVIVVKFLDKNKKKIKSAEFWGTVNSAGTRHRYYHGQAYMLWETPSPYVYRVDNYWRSFFYYSQSLTGPIMPLNKSNIDKSPLDEEAKKVLYKFSDENCAGITNSNRTTDDVVIEASVDVITFVFQVMIQIALESSFDSRPSGRSGDGGRQPTVRKR